MNKPFLLLLAVISLLASNPLGAQCPPPSSAIEYTGGGISTSGTYKISSGNQILSNLPTGATLYVTGTGSVTISKIDQLSSQVFVCGGGSATVNISTGNLNDGVDYSNLTVGPRGAVTFRLFHATNAYGFNLGQLKENAAVSVCATSSNVLPKRFASTPDVWTNYTGNTNGKSFVIIGHTNSFNSSNSSVSNTDNVDLVDYATYTHKIAAPPTTKGTKYGPNFLGTVPDYPGIQRSIACDPAELVRIFPTSTPSTPSTSGTVLGAVLEDTNSDRTGEKPMPGITITLKDDSGSIINTVTTDARGEYTLTVPDKKNYKVEQTVPAGYVAVTPNSVTVDFSGTTTPIQSANFVNRSTNLVCNPVGALGVGEDSKVFISTLNRSKAQLEKLKSIKNGQLVLDSKHEGLNLPHVSKLSTIKNPEDGMIIYDPADKCVKLYQNGKWGCINEKNCVKVQPIITKKERK